MKRPVLFLLPVSFLAHGGPILAGEALPGLLLRQNLDGVWGRVGTEWQT